MLDGLTQDEIAFRLGVNRVTVTRWEARPAFQRYMKKLEEEQHRATVDAHHRVATRGAQLRLRVLEKLSVALDTIGVPDGLLGEDGRPLPPHVDTEALARIAAALDRLTTSAEDRAGFVTRKAVEVTGANGGPVAVVSLTPDQLASMTPDQLRALAAVASTESEPGS